MIPRRFRCTAQASLPRLAASGVGLRPTRRNHPNRKNLRGVMTDDGTPFPAASCRLAIARSHFPTDPAVEQPARRHACLAAMEGQALNSSVRERFDALALGKLQLEPSDAETVWGLLVGCAPVQGADSLGPPEVRGPADTFSACRILLCMI